MNNNAYRCGIAAAGLSLFWVGNAQAVAPVISNIPDIVISDFEDNIGTDNNLFVFPNAFAFNSYVSDADTPLNTLKWSFDEGTDVDGGTGQFFTINGVNPNATGDAAIAAAAANPASRLNPTNDIRTTDTASFRDIVLSPAAASLPIPTAAANVLDRHAAGKVVRFYVSDQTFVVSRDVLVSSVDSDTTPSQDKLSGGFTVLKTDAFASDAGWEPSGALPPLLTGAIGSRGYDPANTALRMTVAATNRTRVIGYIESPAGDVPYSDIGTNFVRAKFSVFYSGAGDSNVLANANLVPNFRLSLRTKGAVNTVLEVKHNAQDDGSPADLNITRELGPSKNASAPSVYRVDFDPVDVPFLTTSTTEGVQRAMEAYVTGAATFVVGDLFLTDSSIGTYPALDLSSTPLKVYATGGSPGSADFDNSTVNLGRLGFTVNTLARYFGATNSAADFYLWSLLTGGASFTEPTMVITKSAANGIVVNSSTQPTNRVGFASADFLEGVFGDTNATKARVEPGKIYVVSARFKSDGSSSTQPYTRFSARSLGFGYNQTLELLGSRGLPGAAGQAIMAQVMPGSGTAVPGTTGDGSTYNLIFNSPINGDIRADVAGPLTTKFPQILGQAGPGVGTPSKRDLNVGFTVIDSLSLVDVNTVDAAEVANNLTLNRIEIREYPQIND